MNLSSLANQIITQAGDANRHLVAIAGPPAAGKSTISARLCAELIKRGETCAVVPMDGFHLDNAILKEKGLLKRKGSPATFDALGFFHLITRLRSAGEPVYLPVFDRQRDLAIAGATFVEADCKYLLVEGNYLLLDSDPWNKLKPFWNSTVFVNPGLGLIEERLLDRWLQHGLDFSDAIDRARDNDIPNAKTVLDNSIVMPDDIIIDGTFDIKA